jgi:hypothetical protein
MWTFLRYLAFDVLKLMHTANNKSLAECSVVVSSIEEAELNVVGPLQPPLACVAGNIALDDSHYPAFH